MSKYKIALLPGDGIGKEVMGCAIDILKELNVNASFEQYDIGWELWKKHGNALPEETIDNIKKCDCALLGAITSKNKTEAENELCEELKGKGYKYVSPIIQLRQKLNLHTNIRPCKSIKGNILNYKEDIDITIFRENTEGSYCGIEYYPMPSELYNVIYKDHKNIQLYGNENSNKIAVSLRIMTEKACERIIYNAFEYASKNNKRKVTVVDKPNILRETGGLFFSVARRIAKKYKNIELEEVNIDALCMWIIKQPYKYEVIVAENLFGDIISDLTAQLIGGMGFAYSGNFSDEFAIFEPVHGSAPKYYGLNKVNPIAMLLSVSFMLDWLGEKDKSNILIKAIEEVVQERRIGTYDMGLNNTNIEVNNEIRAKIKKLVK